MEDSAPQIDALEALNKLRCSIESVRGIEVLEWLSKQDRFPRFYWRSQDGDFEVAASGAAHRLTPGNFSSASNALDLLSHFVKNHPLHDSIIAVGGASFWPTSNPSEQWNRFQQFEFILPQTALIRDKSSLRLVRMESDQSNFISELKSERSNGHVSITATEQPEFSEWCNAVNLALSEIKTAKLEKVVLARKTTIPLNTKVESIAIFRMLRETQQVGSPFLFEQDKHSSFMGVSPERLFLLKNELLSAEAVGGTAPISDAGSLELLNDSKNREEHALVVTHLRKVLEKFVSKLNFDTIPSIRKMKDLMHLRSDVSGNVKNNLSLGSLFRALHPTPAVCGTPTERALQLISKLEGFARGWYAGPIGVISSARTEFNVAIRSLLISAGHAEIFAGAGIVEGSVAQDEWQELNRKAALPLKLLASLEHDSISEQTALAI